MLTIFQHMDFVKVDIAEKIKWPYVMLEIEFNFAQLVHSIYFEQMQSFPINERS